MFLNYSNIPGYQNLFLDYLYNFEKVKNFYLKNFRDINSYPVHFEAVLKSEKSHKKDLPEIIKNQYRNNLPSLQTTSNIDALANNNTLAVVTGQQLGLFGGPLYTFYKTITAIKLCNYLKEKYDGLNFVPVFWLEADDHDFVEVNNIKLINDSNDIVKFIYKDPEVSEDNHFSVGNIKFNQSIESLIEELNTFLRDTEFKPDLINRLKSFYNEGKTFKDAFKELLFNVFDEFGLILFDPQDNEIKNILKPVFRNELENFRKHSDEIIKRSAELEESYHAQVKVNPINLFMNDGDGRFLLEPAEENEFRLRGKRKKISSETVFSTLENDPSKFSPNVLLRPICQDYIFPTAFYIAGPSEIDYFAQVIPLYKNFNVEQPVVYPRASITIIEKNIKKIFDKFSLIYQDVFLDRNILFENVIKQISQINIEDEFKKYEDDVALSSKKLSEVLLNIDNTLEDSITKTQKRILESTAFLKEKTLEAQKKKHEITLRQLNKISVNMYPNTNLQERELNFIHFTNKFGMDVIKWIINEIVINRFEHQIIEL